jgi:hypothetical protein
MKYTNEEIINFIASKFEDVEKSFAFGHWEYVTKLNSMSITVRTVDVYYLLLLIDGAKISSIFNDEAYHDQAELNALKRLIIKFDEYLKNKEIKTKEALINKLIGNS